VVGGPLVLLLELIDQHPGVESQILAVRAQEAPRVDGAGKQIPFLVLDRPQVLRADLGPAFDLVHVDPGANARLSQRRTDIGHRPSKAIDGPPDERCS
jgi:hypothetical protein